ncbi:MAG: GTPase Era [Lachnospiraceae bacterium]|nr:GTPase Era [Lachnospiraceae bacterium]
MTQQNERETVPTEPSGNSAFRSGFAAIIGRPNVGKSTLMNHLIGQKIAITSEKPQTTRGRIRTVYTDERGQIVFLDTPGRHRGKNRLDDYMLRVGDAAIGEADLILWLIEPRGKMISGDEEIAAFLAKAPVPVFLIVNKTDAAAPEAVAATIEAYRGAASFAEVVPLSALRSRNTDTLLELIFRYLPEGPRYYDEETVTDQSVREIAAEIIREKALRNLSDEIPHGIAVVMDRVTEREDGLLEIDASIVCEKESHKGIIIGKGGAMLKRIGTQARLDIEKMAEQHVSLKLWVKVRKEWRDNDRMLRSFGYKDES